MFGIQENRAFSRWSIENSLHLTRLTSKIFPIPSKPYFVANHDCAIHLTSLPSAALPFVLTLNACIITEVFLSSNKLLTSNAHLSCLKNETLRFSFLLWRTQNFFSTNSVFVLGDFLPNEKQHETFKKKTIFLFRSLPFFRSVSLVRMLGGRVWVIRVKMHQGGSTFYSRLGSQKNCYTMKRS